MNVISEPLGPNNLLLVRTLRAPRALLWRCWTEPELLCQWFCPKPWYVSEAVIDLRPGGRFFSMMNGPNGEVFPNEGSLLEVVPMERLAFPDLMAADWQPVEAGMGFSATVTFRDAPEGGTTYTALARHRNPAERDKHAEMGFEPGWGTAAAQLDELALTLA